MEGEQFSLCWNNFHNNLSTGFHSLLQDEDLVDVTLAAEGQYLKAHKAVLSVCSPYFKELFRANPCKHPIVILQDVKYTALSNLLHFMYQGEVSVRQDEIPLFMRVAQMLKVKGLTENTTERNGLDSSFRESPLSNSLPDPKPQMLKRKQPKKLIKPIQHLRPIETLRSPPPEPPNKRPHIEETTVKSREPAEPFIPKEEPFESANEDSKDVTCDSHASTKLEVSVDDPSPSFHWAADLKVPPDTSSPGVPLFVKSRKGHSVLIYNGHIYTLNYKHEARVMWVCVKRNTLNCKGCLTTVNGPVVLSSVGHNHPQLHDVIQQVLASSCSPSPELLV